MCLAASGPAMRELGDRCNGGPSVTAPSLPSGPPAAGPGPDIEEGPDPPDKDLTDINVLLEDYQRYGPSAEGDLIPLGPIEGETTISIKGSSKGSSPAPSDEVIDVDVPAAAQVSS